jgi:hypothetical protein
MSRPALQRILSALLVISAVACVSPTAPAPARTRAPAAPHAGASFDDITPPPSDSTCRSGYMSGQGYTC